MPSPTDRLFFGRKNELAAVFAAVDRVPAAAIAPGLAALDALLNVSSRLEPARTPDGRA